MRGKLRNNVATFDLQCGAAKESKKSGNEMLDAWPDPRTGENCFHVFARNNYAREIKRYSDDDGQSASFTRLCLEANNQVSRTWEKHDNRSDSQLRVGFINADTFLLSTTYTEFSRYMYIVDQPMSKPHN